MKYYTTKRLTPRDIKCGEAASETGNRLYVREENWMACRAVKQMDVVTGPCD